MLIFIVFNARLCFEHDVRLSVCPSVTLVDCDHVGQLQQKVEMGT